MEISFEVLTGVLGVNYTVNVFSLVEEDGGAQRELDAAPTRTHVCLSELLRIFCVHVTHCVPSLRVAIMKISLCFVLFAFFLKSLCLCCHVYCIVICSRLDCSTIGTA